MAMNIVQSYFNYKIIFLDFDGVISTPESHWDLDTDKIKLVKHICDVTGAKIVISSSWRKYNLEDTLHSITTSQEQMGRQRFLYPEYLIDVTPRMYSFKHGHRETYYQVCRGVEIDQWLKEHKNVDRYVILDDEDDMLLYQKTHLVKTDSNKGISQRDAEEAIKILTSKIDWHSQYYILTNN